jgi:SSS family solute:Na+ symporter
MSIRADGSGEQVQVQISNHPGSAPDWRPDKILVKPLGEPRARPDDPGASSTDAFVRRGDILAKTDSERAYVVMMRRFLPTGLLGLAIAALLAAFMSTVDTHVNLASSFFINDIYRRFLVPHRRPRHYVFAARLASAGVLALAGFLAYHADSISQLFTFFLAFLSGVGPIYVMRWLWWRVRAATEIVAMISSSVAATWLTFGQEIAAFLQTHQGWDAPVRWAAHSWQLGPLSPGGELAPAGRLILVVCFSGLCSIASILLLKKPDPGELLAFYKKVRPMGWWGPVRQRGRVDTPVPSAVPTMVGVLGGLALIYGLLFGIGGWLLDRSSLALGCLGLAVIGKELVSWSLGKLQEEEPPPADDVAPPDGGEGLPAEG